ALRHERARRPLRQRLKERGQALADAQEALETGLARRDGKLLGAALAAADPDGLARAPIDWGRDAETLTLWLGRLWEADDPYAVLSAVGDRPSAVGQADSRQPTADSRFGGFCPDTFRFLADLADHNARSWLEEQRTRYRFAVRAPLVELCKALARRYVEPVLI